MVTTTITVKVRGTVNKLVIVAIVVIRVPVPLCAESTGEEEGENFDSWD